MVIESRYCRAELRTDLAWLKQNRAHRRWSEKQLILFERRFMLVPFQVRSLLERLKINDAARRTVMPILKYKKVGERPFTYSGAGWPHDRLDMEHPEFAVLSAHDVCNQLIHHYWMQTWSQCGSFAGMLISSDYMRHKWAYEFRVSDLIRLFCTFGEDSSAIINLGSNWSEKKQDYIITRSSGSNELGETSIPSKPTSNSV